MNLLNITGNSTMNRMNSSKLYILFVFLLLFTTLLYPLQTLAQTRNTIRIVGSSTVYPFTTAVAETFGRQTPYPTPIIETTGTGGGFKLFCSGIGPAYPDINNASRPIKQSEYTLCAQNGIPKDAIREVHIGFDGIVLANSTQAPLFNLTPKQIFLALAAYIPYSRDLAARWIKNRHQKWNDINPNLPPIPIRVYGPPSTSGTRDAFVELAMEKGCEEFPELHFLSQDNKKEACQRIREDGAFIEAGENDNLIIQKLTSDTQAIGIFGYSFLDQNLDRIQGTLINSVEPTFDTIKSGEYPIARPLFLYVKEAHLNIIPGITEFISEYLSPRAIGDFGYLLDIGLIPVRKP